MKNKLIDLNNHLFMQLERLSDEDLSAEQIETEIRRTNAITVISDKIIDNAKVAIRAAELVAEYGGQNYQALLPLLEGKNEIKEHDA